MTIIDVGSVLPAMVGKSEGVYFEADGNGYTLIYNFASPTKDEIDSVKKESPFEIRFMVKGCILWIFTKCGSLNWTDASYTPHLSSDVADLQKPSNENDGTMLTLIMTDANNAVVKSSRVIGLGNKFSISLFDEIKELAKRPFDSLEYQRDLAQTMALPTKDLVRMTKDYWKLR